MTLHSVETAPAKVPKLTSSIREMGRKNQMNLDSLSIGKKALYFPRKKRRKGIFVRELISQTREKARLLPEPRPEPRALPARPAELYHGGGGHEADRDGVAGQHLAAVAGGVAVAAPETTTKTNKSNHRRPSWSPIFKGLG